MGRLIWGFAGCTYHIVKNLMSGLYCLCVEFWNIAWSCPDSEQRTGGRTPPHSGKSQSFSNTGPEPLVAKKAIKPAFNVRPSWARHGRPMIFQMWNFTLLPLISLTLAILWNCRLVKTWLPMAPSCHLTMLLWRYALHVMEWRKSL